MNIMIVFKDGTARYYFEVKFVESSSVTNETVVSYRDGTPCDTYSIKDILKVVFL